MTTIGEIFDIPDRVHQGDFVLRLTEGIQHDWRKQALQAVCCQAAVGEMR